MHSDILLLKQLGISLLLGLLVGLQREHAAARLAGVRTFAFSSSAGTRRSRSSTLSTFTAPA